ncbi:hypothetical protein [uncultured Nevskia sp.]|uniref:c-type cytochrome n=1 Tax=uncultured Nevskia sp. TaxID=228950 RepID=UPI0025E5372A|nr:hypothetical protein [uncultured Nevskia sp.]
MLLTAPRLLLAISLIAAGAARPVIAAAQPPRPSLSPLASSCQGCHQPAVNAGTMPALDRYTAARIAASLRAARDQPEPGSIMARFAQHLSDAEIDALATELGRPGKAGTQP